jgi:hypothetical protein
MITVDLFAGMGNQLFQYFMGYALSRKKNIPIVYSTNNYKLSHFNFPIKFVQNKTSINNLLIRDSSFNYRNIPICSNCRIRGYWQSEKYFKDYRNDILKLFNIQTTSLETISVHVRRGDYLLSTSKHPVQNNKYYIDAVNILGQNMKVYVFSDDMNWCKNNLPKTWHFIENQTDIQDFIMMAKNKYHVISNSTFSWWAAWINGEKVIAPKKWFGPELKHLNTQDIIPEKWIKL